VLLWPFISSISDPLGAGGRRLAGANCTFAAEAVGQTRVDLGAPATVAPLEISLSLYQQNLCIPLAVRTTSWPFFFSLFGRGKGNSAKKPLPVQLRIAATQLFPSPKPSHLNATTAASKKVV